MTAGAFDGWLDCNVTVGDHIRFLTGLTRFTRLRCERKTMENVADIAKTAASKRQVKNISLAIIILSLHLSL